MPHQSLVLTLIAPHSTGLISEITSACSKHDCNILESKLSNMGCECVISMHIDGKWSDLAKIESFLNKLEKRDELQLQVKRTDERSFEEKFMPYAVHVTTADSSGIAALVTTFFTDQGVDIEEMSTNRYMTNRTMTAMQTLSLTVLLPVKIHLADFRDSFIVFCDEYNLDAIFEPERG